MSFIEQLRRLAADREPAHQKLEDERLSLKEKKRLASQSMWELTKEASKYLKPILDDINRELLKRKGNFAHSLTSIPIGFRLEWDPQQSIFLGLDNERKIILAAGGVNWLGEDTTLMDPNWREKVEQAIVTTIESGHTENPKGYLVQDTTVDRAND